MPSTQFDASSVGIQPVPNSDSQERWMQEIRGFAPKLERAERSLARQEALLKKLLAQRKLQAVSVGCKTVASQEIFADNDDDVFKARLRVGVAKGRLVQLKVELDAIKLGFEEWRTHMVNRREEVKRYGA